MSESRVIYKVYQSPKIVSVKKTVSNKTQSDNTKMPTKVLKQGRPKGADLTFIGLPIVKKVKGNEIGTCRCKNKAKQGEISVPHLDHIMNA